MIGSVDGEFLPVIAKNGDTMTIQNKIDAISNHFNGWADAESEISGFIAWTWDMREETLANLTDGDLDEAAGEINQSVTQEHPHRRSDFTAAAEEWLREHRDELIDALEKSLTDD